MSDLLSGIGSAVTGLVGEVAGEAGGIPDPIASGIELIANAVGLDPKITGAIELGAAFFTGDLACAMHGANDILNGKSKSASTDASSPSAPPTPGYASPAKADLPTPPAQMDDHTVLQTIRDNYAAIDTDGDGKIGYAELKAAANNPNLPQNVRDACQGLLSNTALISEFITPTDAPFTHQNSPSESSMNAWTWSVGAGPNSTFSIDSLDEELTKHPASSAPTTPSSTPSTSGDTGVAPSSVANGDVNTSGETYQQALQTISDNFSLFDTAAGVGAPDGLIGRNDLQAILNNPGVSADVKAAAKFMLDNPAYFNEAETAQYGGKMDGLLGKGDVAAALAQVKGATPASGSNPTSGSAPASAPASGTPASGTDDSDKASDTSNTDGSKASSPSADDSSSDTTVSTGGATGGSMDDTLSNLEGNAKDQMAALQKQVESGKLSASDLQKVQDKLQQMEQLMETISNMQKALHDMEMAIISNMR